LRTNLQEHWTNDHLVGGESASGDGSLWVIGFEDVYDDYKNLKNSRLN